MRRLIVRLFFYPTLAWNLFWTRGVGVWRWGSRVDDHVILGALPFASLVPELRAQGVRAVVNTCEEFAGPTREYEHSNIQQLWVPTLDFTPPTLESVERAVEFLQAHVHRGETVYVHCKAGRGRSATVVLCWLLQAKNMTPQQAQAYLQEKRPQVVKHLFRREVVQQFYRKRMIIRDQSENSQIQS